MNYLDLPTGAPPEAPPVDPYSDEALGLQPPALPAYPSEQTFQPGVRNRILEAIYGGTQGVDFAQPHGFGESFLQGLTGSLAGQGEKVASARQKFETRQEQRRLLTDQQRQKATEDYNKRKSDALGEMAKEKRGSVRKAAEEATQEAAQAIPVTPVLAQRYPALKGFVGQSLPERVMKQYTGQTPAEKATSDNAALSSAYTDMAARGVLSGLPINNFVSTRNPKQFAAIANRAGELDPNADIALNRAGYGADKASLQKAQLTYDGFKSFEKGALYNMEPLKKYLGRVPELGNTPMNAWARAGALALGSKDAAAFRVYVNSVSTEAGRLINNANIYLDLSEGARKDLDALKNGALTGNQMLEVLDALKTEFDNRGKGQEETINVINERIKQRGPGSAISAGGALTDAQARAEFDAYMKARK